MAPHPGIDTEQIREKARKDLLELLEGVCKARPAPSKATLVEAFQGSGQEELGDSEIAGWSYWSLRQILDASAVWGGQGLFPGEQQCRRIPEECYFLDSGGASCTSDIDGR